MGRRKALIMQSVAREETLASSSTNKASQNPGFSLKIKAKKISSSSSGAQKKARSIQKKRGFKRSGASMENKSSQKMVRARDAEGRFIKKGTNGDKSQVIYMPIQQASDGKTAEAIVVKKENNDN